MELYCTIYCHTVHKKKKQRTGTILKETIGTYLGIMDEYENTI